MFGQDRDAPDRHGTTGPNPQAGRVPAGVLLFDLGMGTEPWQGGRMMLAEARGACRRYRISKIQVSAARGWSRASGYNWGFLGSRSWVGFRDFGTRFCGPIANKATTRAAALGPECGKGLLQQGDAQELNCIGGPWERQSRLQPLRELC